MSVRVAEFAPHAGLSSDDIDTRIFGVELVDISPFNVTLIRFAVSVAEADVEIGKIVVREDYFICAID